MSLLWEPADSKSRNLGFNHFLLARILAAGEPHGRAWKRSRVCLPAVEAASHPPATSIVQPALPRAAFWQLIFWMNIAMQTSRWNLAKLLSFTDLGFVWQVPVLPKSVLSYICLRWWGNPAKPGSGWPIHWGCSPNPFMPLKTELPFGLVKLLNTPCFLNFILCMSESFTTSCITLF